MGEPIDFDFFDDAPGTGTNNALKSHEASASTFTDKEERTLRHTSTSSDSETDSRSDIDLHGDNEPNQQEPKNEKKISSPRLSYDSSELPSGTSASKASEEINDKHSDSSTQSDVLETNSEFHGKKQKKKPKPLNITAVQHDDSSDSMTDVSPLSSPSGSPSIERRSFQQKSQSHDPQNNDVRHITKLNVVFRNSHFDGHDEHSRLQKTSRNSGITDQSIAWSTDSSDDDDDHADAQKHIVRMCNEKPISHRHVNTRQNKAVNDHRRRLLDSAAKGSMDVSSLLETVLEFEQENYQRKVRNRETPAYPFNEEINCKEGRRQRKNMSFTNDQVRDIDRENKRLLNEITSRSRPSSASSMRSSRSARSSISNSSRKSSASSRVGTGRRRDNEKPVKLYHSTINRLQFQRIIERENMQLLKRLQTAKPTATLQRQRLLTDYKRQADYMGSSIDRNGMSIQKAQELTRNAEVVQNAIGVRKQERTAKPAWQESW